MSVCAGPDSFTLGCTGSIKPRCLSLSVSVSVVPLSVCLSVVCSLLLYVYVFLSCRLSLPTQALLS